ncbi:hypothetical protein MVES1_002818 [Malassezia vespertilionis]|uniref:Enoyl reductase (ER) domain-containing protein n=1 Tax=Malassezia vespertilionis TaxID=2020962 RepID=A0A2N1JAQ0_9BASI|nr:uncharacterized protein MVES1_002818 [Malassezia vespertilionis]PKI83572.1 hypothetical protein MVES_002662 [Malassezia vespertilionis]WFD07453.1 hypothetical protein MVES1_002818 [Malassezia vespertilionis]
MENSLPTPRARANVSYVLESVGHTLFEDRPVRPLTPHEVRVNVRQTGLCGSDCHYKTHGQIGDFVLRAPMVLGHESAGIITEVGSAVTNRKVGDRVALEPGVPCLACDECIGGTYNQCLALVFAATPPYDGTLATYYNIHASFAHPLPHSLSLEAGSLMEPLSVAVHATVARGQVRALENVLVFGAGPVGLLIAAVARAYGARRVVSVDLIDEKLAFAKSFCATSTFKPVLPAAGTFGMDNTRRNMEALVEREGLQREGGFDLVLDATGALSCLQMAAFAGRPRGRIVTVGMGNPVATLPLTHMLVKEMVMLGSFRYGAGDFEKSIALVSDGLINVERLVTHRYLFEDADKAFATTELGKGEDGRFAIKVQLCQGAAS